MNCRNKLRSSSPARIALALLLWSKREANEGRAFQFSLRILARKFIGIANSPAIPKRFFRDSPLAMEDPNNGGLLYHEVQEAKLCAVHCVNTVLQGPFFSEVDLAALASDLDQTEREMMIEGSGVGGFSGDFLSEGSYNVSMRGDFSIQVLQKALEVWDLQVIPLDSPVAEASKYDPELENAFICHLQDHWFCIRKVNGEWYNFNSLYPAPEHLSKFYLSAYLDSLKGSGWSIFLVRGNFPKECPITATDATNGFGQWLTPDDAKRITMSCNQLKVPRPREQSAPAANPEPDAIAQQEEQDLRAAIAASLMDFSASGSGYCGADDKGSSVDNDMTAVNSVSGLAEDNNATHVQAGND